MFGKQLWIIKLVDTYKTHIHSEWFLCPGRSSSDLVYLIVDGNHTEINMILEIE